MDMDINSEPGAGRADKNIDSKDRADGATEIPNTIIESIKEAQDK